MNKQYLEGYDVRSPEVFRQGQTVRFRRGFHTDRAGQLGTILDVDNFNFSRSLEYTVLLLTTGQVLSFIDESEIVSYENR